MLSNRAEQWNFEMAAKDWKQTSGKFKFLEHKGGGALVWVSSELAGRWFYSSGRLTARNGHQSGAEKPASKKKRGDRIWIFNQCSQTFCLGSEISILLTLVQLVFILAIALDLFLNTEAKQPDGFTTKQVGVVCTLLFLAVVCVNWKLPSSKVRVSKLQQWSHDRMYVRRICQLLVGR